MKLSILLTEAKTPAWPKNSLLFLHIPEEIVKRGVTYATLDVSVDTSDGDRVFYQTHGGFSYYEDETYFNSEVRVLKKLSNGKNNKYSVAVTLTYINNSSYKKPTKVQAKDLFAEVISLEQNKKIIKSFLAKYGFSTAQLEKVSHNNVTVRDDVHHDTVAEIASGSSSIIDAMVSARYSAALAGREKSLAKAKLKSEKLAASIPSGAFRVNVDKDFVEKTPNAEYSDTVESLINDDKIKEFKRDYGSVFIVNDSDFVSINDDDRDTKKIKDFIENPETVEHLSNYDGTNVNYALVKKGAAITVIANSVDVNDFERDDDDDEPDLFEKWVSKTNKKLAKHGFFIDPATYSGSRFGVESYGHFFTVEHGGKILVVTIHES